MGRLDRRIMRNKPVGFLVGSLLTVCFVLLLPIILPTALIDHRKRTRKTAALISNFVCVSCGSTLGPEAIRLGDERWSAIVDDLRKRLPKAKRFRTVRDIHAVCPKCGCEYMY